MDLSVITVTWNAEDNIREQIKSVISGCKNISVEEIIVDNGSSDRTIEEIQKFRNFEIKERTNIQLIQNAKNLGFGAANNIGAKISQGDYLLFLNPDMRVEEGSLDVIVEWLEKNSKVGLAGCRLINQNGNFNVNAGPRKHPKVWEQLLLIFKIPHLIPEVLDNYLMKNFDDNIGQEVDSIRGSFFLMRREVYEKLGWAFDPRYYIWFEDADTCREVWKLGYQVVYTPIISCVDYVGQSFKKRDSYWKQQNFTRSMLQYFQKWEPWYKWVWIAISRPFGLSLTWFNDKIKF